jgi:23S rRNA (adenine2503-C2)-methyltransferase
MAEIVDQVLYCLGQTRTEPSLMKRLDIMFMSMGEPLLNWSEVRGAISLLDYEYNYPTARFLVSTVAPRRAKWDDLLRTSKIMCNFGLQFSVHASTNAARKKIIPYDVLTLEEIAAYGTVWHLVTGRKPVFNYCCTDRNSYENEVYELLKTFNPEIWSATCSVVCPTGSYAPSERKFAESFAGLLGKRGYDVRVFDPAGQDDIGAGCGQLWYTQEYMEKRKRENAN